MTPRTGETPEQFRARLRARCTAADPEYRERLLARLRERRRQRYNSSWNSSANATRLTRVSAKDHGTAAETLSQEDERVEPVSGLGAARPFPPRMKNRDQYSRIASAAWGCPTDTHRLPRCEGCEVSRWPRCPDPPGSPGRFSRSKSKCLNLRLPGATQ